MSIRQIDLVLKLPPADVTDAQFKLLMHLADYARPDGTHIYAGPARLAKATGYNERTVRIALRGFEQKGWLIRERSGGGRGRWPVYRLNLPGSPMPPLPFPGLDRGPVENRLKGDRRIPLLAVPQNQKGDPPRTKGDPPCPKTAVSDSPDSGSTSDPSMYPSSTDQELPALRAGTPAEGGTDAAIEAPGATPGVSVSATLRDRESVLRLEGGELPDVRRLGGGRSGQGVELGVPAPDERTRVPGDRGSRGVAPAPEQIDALVALKARLFGGV